MERSGLGLGRLGGGHAAAALRAWLAPVCGEGLRPGLDLCGVEELSAGREALWPRSQLAGQGRKARGRGDGRKEKGVR